MGAHCSRCWFGDDTSPALRTEAAEAVRKLDPKTLTNILTTITTQINEQKGVIEDKRKAREEAERNLVQSAAEAEADPYKHTATGLQVLKTLAGVARVSFDDAQRAMSGLVTKKCQIEQALTTFHDQQRRDHLKTVTLDISQKIKEFSVDVQDEDDEAKEVMLVDVPMEEQDNTRLLDVIESIKADPRMSRLVEERRVFDMAHQLPPVPSSSSGGKRGGGHEGLSEPRVLEFTSLLDSAGIPSSAWHPETRRGGKPKLGTQQSNEIVALCTDSL